MHKLFCLILALLMLPCAALAEAADAADATLYTHPVDGYSFSMPADWTIMDPSLLVSEAEDRAESSDDAADNRVIAMSPDGMDNMDVIASDLGEALTPEEVITNVCPDAAGEYTSSFPGIVVEDAGSIVTIGNRQFVRVTMSYQLMENFSQRMHRYIILEDTIMYCMTFTHNSMGEAITPEDMEALCAPFLESLVLPGETAA